MKKEYIQKSIKLRKDLVEKIDKEREQQTRNFTQQIEHIIKKYYDIKDE